VHAITTGLADLDKAAEESGKRICVPWYFERAWRCIPKGSAIHGDVVFSWRDGKLSVHKKRRDRFEHKGVLVEEAAFFHLHKWKKTRDLRIQTYDDCTTEDGKHKEFYISNTLNDNFAQIGCGLTRSTGGVRSEL
jgi:hypothetical protein